MAEIECACIEWRARLRDMTHRLSETHGDFHPGNIWFPEGCLTEEDCRAGLRLLDRSRGPWGEPADDLTALTINYVFWGIMKNGGLTGAYREALELFYEEYLGRTGDWEVLEVAAPFYAFRGAVVANPVFYPDVTPAQRAAIFRFVREVLAAPRFDPWS
jgi:aminoglycoside phosphotransferase (APT) family kinase protein